MQEAVRREHPRRDLDLGVEPPFFQAHDTQAEQAGQRVDLPGVQALDRDLGSKHALPPPSGPLAGPPRQA